jgi:RNA polymerase sigma-70 factor (ECF subfamily)
VEVSDEVLCQQVAERDEAAFGRLVERYQRRAYGIAWSILRDAEEARDLSQEAFIRLYEHAHRFRGQARFSTWFYRILVNLCLDHRRRQHWWRRVVVPPNRHEDPTDAGDSLVERQPAPARDPLDDLHRERLMKQVWEAVDRLSPRQRAAVLLQVQEGLPTAEIAAVLRCSEATVRVHLHRALMALRTTMGRS